VIHQPGPGTGGKLFNIFPAKILDFAPKIFGVKSDEKIFEKGKNRCEETAEPFAQFVSDLPELGLDVFQFLAHGDFSRKAGGT
jgi:hypothetical protein